MPETRYLTQPALQYTICTVFLCACVQGYGWRGGVRRIDSGTVGGGADVSLWTLTVLHVPSLQALIAFPLART